ncbi:MAG TPA: branched-chain amino acid ABC transporter permease [bacterium]|nr:branched-chain amino acid ABC transporter permease [bacterium]
MTATSRPWRRTLRTGLLWGTGAVFVALVGLVEVLQGKEIITGVIAGGHLLMLLLAAGAGLSAARPQAHRPGVAVGSAAASGLVAGLVVGALVALASAMPLRGMFVAASPELFAILSFGRGVAALPWIALTGAAVAAGGGALIVLPRAIRALLSAMIGALLVIGLLHEQVQLLLQADRLTPLRELVFSFEGLTPVGALLIAGVSAAVSGLWQVQRPRMGARIAALPPQGRRRLRLVGMLASVLGLLVLPLFVGPFFSQVLVLVGLYTLMGLGLNLEVGFAGLLDLGFVAFFAAGAYTVGLLTTGTDLAVASLSWWSAMLVAVVVSLIAGVFFGLPVLGIRGDYLAIATLGFGEIIRLLVLSDFLRPWLGGSQGVLGIPKPVLFGFEFRGPEQLFFITVGASAVIAFIAARLRDSRLGRAWMAMREDEDVAQAMGINLVNVKLLAYGIGAIFAGVSGAIFAVMVGSVFPHSFSVLVSINVLALIIVGGMGSLPGVVVGALFLVGLPELLREFSDFRYLVYGAALMAMMILRPEGLWPSAAQRRELHEEIETVPPGEMIEAEEV